MRNPDHKGAMRMARKAKLEKGLYCKGMGTIPCNSSPVLGIGPEIGCKWSSHLVHMLHDWFINSQDTTPLLSMNVVNPLLYCVHSAYS